MPTAPWHAWRRLLAILVTTRHRGDSNPCGQSPMDFESISLAARTQCHVSGESFDATLPHARARWRQLEIYSPHQRMRRQRSTCLWEHASSVNSRFAHRARGCDAKDQALPRFANKTVWPSGLRRWLQAPVCKGVGSNPTAVPLQASCCGHSNVNTSRVCGHSNCGASRVWSMWHCG